MGAKILVLEDQLDILQIMTYALKSAGHEVLPAYGCEDAVYKAKRQRPDLILTDLAMPHISGVELIRRIKNDPEVKHIPIVAVTAHLWDQIAQSAGEVGVDGFVSKPFTPKQLISEVQKYLPDAE